MINLLRHVNGFPLTESLHHVWISLRRRTSEVYPLISHESVEAKFFKPCAHKLPFTRERSPNRLDVVEKSHHRRKA